jgi:uncharacterized membrane protein YoaK (UPF0700 family)
MSDPSRTSPSLVVSLAALTVVSGFLDSVSYLGLGHVFTANMTGNVALLGFALAGAAGFSSAASLCALGGFLVGAVVGGRIARRAPVRRDLLMAVMAIEVAFTIAAASIAAAVSASGLGSGWPRFTVIALLATSMGARNTAVRRLGVADMTTTVLTTTLTGLASDSSLAGGTNPNVSHRLVSVVSMFAGATVGAVLTIHVHPALALGVAAVLVTMTAVVLLRERPAELGLA